MYHVSPKTGTLTLDAISKRAREAGKGEGIHKRQDGTRVSLPSPLAVLEVSPRRMRKTGEPVVRRGADAGETRMEGGKRKKEARLEGVEWEKRRRAKGSS